MKVLYTLIVRCSPDSPDSIVDEYREFRKNVEARVAEGAAIELPLSTDIRWVIESGRQG